MWNKLLGLIGFSKKSEVSIPDDIHQRIEFNLGVLTHDVIQTYSVRKAMSIRLRMSSKSPKELSDWLSESGRIVDTAAYVPEPWKAGIRVEESFMLDDFMSHDGYVVDMQAWYATNQPRIKRIVKAFNKLDDGDREYYQRMYTSVLRDVDAILTGIKAACN